MMCKISVAMAVYNGEKYIEKQLISILNQTRLPDEVIICDDGSKDRTVDIIENFIDIHSLSNWKLYSNKSNVGFSKNFYNSIKKTTGDIIFLCDQDDIWHEDKIKKMEKIFVANKKIKALVSSFDLINENGMGINIKLSNKKSNNNIIKYKVKSKLEKISKDTIFLYNISPGCTMAFTKDIKDIYLKNTNCNCIHDWEISMLAALSDGLYYLDLPLIDYRIHSKNAVGLGGILENSGRKKALNREYREKNAEKVYRYLSAFKECYNSYIQDLKIDRHIEFTKERLRALKDRNLFKILCLYRYFNSYRKSVTFKGRVADIVCILK